MSVTRVVVTGKSSGNGQTHVIIEVFLALSVGASIFCKYSMSNLEKDEFWRKYALKRKLKTKVRILKKFMRIVKKTIQTRLG